MLFETSDSVTRSQRHVQGIRAECLMSTNMHMRQVVGRTDGRTDRHTTWKEDQNLGLINIYNAANVFSWRGSRR